MKQKNDQFVRAAREENYRSRAAFKLLALERKFGFLSSAHLVVDLGASPGGWSQVAAGILAKRPGTKLISVDRDRKDY